ncbi:MAG TPA: hypothetical protein VGR49_03230 [Actinomycetota bacterium]|jgi:hypothetical protein|nr:hypothetical protein [Actinomycetota bacterium]
MDLSGNQGDQSDAAVRKQFALAQIQPDERLVSQTLALEGMHEAKVAVFLIVTDKRLVWIRDEGPMATVDLWFKDTVASYFYEPTRKLILEAAPARNEEGSGRDATLGAFELAPLGTPEEIVRIVQSLLPEEALETLPDLRGTGTRAKAVIFQRHVALREDGRGVTFRLYHDPFARREQWRWSHDDGVDPSDVEALVDTELAKLQEEIDRERGESVP